MTIEARVSNEAREKLREAERARREAQAAVNRELRASIREAMQSGQESLAADVAAAEAALPPEEPPTAWEEDLRAQIDFVSTSGLRADLNEPIERVLSDLRRRLEVFQAARAARRMKRARELAVDVSPIRIAHVDLPAPDAAIYIAGAQSDGCGMSLNLPAVDGPRPRLLAGRFIAASLVAEARAALEERRELLRRGERFVRQHDRRPAEELAEMIETEIDHKLGFVVEGDDRWRPLDLARRAGYVGGRANMFVAGWASAPRVYVQWLVRRAVPALESEQRALDEAAAWWDAQTAPEAA